MYVLTYYNEIYYIWCILKYIMIVIYFVKPTVEYKMKLNELNVVANIVINFELHFALIDT